MFIIGLLVKMGEFVLENCARKFLTLTRVRLPERNVYLYE